MTKLTVGMCPAMTAQILKLLNAKGIAEVLDFISSDPEKITSLCGLSYKKVLSIRRVLLAQYSSFPINGLTLYKETLNVCAVLSTGCTDLDNILDDGVYTGEITEIVGVSVAGKTQFCQSLAVNVATVLDQNVICIDTTIGWSAKRMNEIFLTRFPDKSSSLSKIRLSQCLLMEELNSTLGQIRSDLQTHQDPFYSSLKLIIIDSVAAVLSPCFFSGTYVEGLSLLQEFGRRLNALAKDFNLAIVVTNNIVSSNTGSDSYVMKPALGRCWTYVPSVRLLFHPQSQPCALTGVVPDLRGQNVPVSVTLDKSPRSEKRFSNFKICTAGIENL